MVTKEQITDLVFNLAESLDETAVRHSSVEIKVKGLRISILGVPEDVTIHVHIQSLEVLKILFQDNIYTVLNCLKLVLFHELKRK